MAVLLLAEPGCTLALQRQRDQCQTSADCQSRAVGAVCTTEGICEATAAVPNGASPPASRCVRDLDCGDEWSRCVDGTCHSLLPDSCAPVGKATPLDATERLPIAVLVPSSASTIDSSATADAVLRAVSALNDASMQVSRVPRVVAVMCPDDDSTALEGLLSAGVKILIDSARPSALEAATAQVNARAVLFAPYGDAPALQSSELASWVVSCTPNRAALGAQTLAAATFLRDALRAAALLPADSRSLLAVSSDEVAWGYSAAFSHDALGSASVERLSYDSAADTSGFVAALTAARVSEASLLVAASSAADWQANIDALELSRAAAHEPEPYYLLSEQELTALDEPTAVPVRYFALGNPGATGGLDTVSDCAYLAVYAAVAGEFRFALQTAQLSPAAIVLGLSALVNGPSPAIPAGQAADVFRALAAARGTAGALDLVGLSGALDFTPLPNEAAAIDGTTNLYLSPPPAERELYCVPADRHEFCESGVRFSGSGAVRKVKASTCPCVVSQ